MPSAQYPAFDLISSLPRDECVRRLRENTDPPRRHSTIYGSGFKVYESAARVNPKPLSGYIGDNDLHIAKQIEGGMSQTRLFAEITDEDGMTRLHCFIGLHPGVYAFWVFWFIGLFFAGIRDVLHPDNATLTINIFGWGAYFTVVGQRGRVRR